MEKIHGLGVQFGFSEAPTEADLRDAVIANHALEEDGCTVWQIWDVSVLFARDLPPGSHVWDVRANCTDPSHGVGGHQCEWLERVFWRPGHLVVLRADQVHHHEMNLSRIIALLTLQQSVLSEQKGEYL